MTCNIPALVENTYSSYQDYEQAVYQYFLSDFANKTLFFRGKKICHKRLPLRKNMSGTFWHIVQSGDNEEEKLPDLDRYKTIRYPFFILENCIDNCENLLTWDKEINGKKRILIYCKTKKYLVILEDRADYIIFWTSYPVKGPRRQTKLENEYLEFKKANSASN